MKKLLFVFTLLTIITLSSARHSDLFPLGTYSFLSEKPWETNNLAVLSSSMRQLGYNSTIMETFNPNADLTTIYQILSDDGIDVIISDKTWKNSAGNEKYATVGLTTGSYYRFEAECKDGSSSINGSLDTESEFWYGTNPTGGNTTDRIGVQHSDNSSSGGYVWRCTPNSDPNVISSGWAYTDLYWRWLTRRNATNRIGQEFKIVKYSPDHPEQDSLYIKFRLEFKNVPHVDDNYPDNTTILSFSPVGFKALFDGTGYITGHESDPTPLVHTLVFPNGSSKTGTVTMLSRGEWLGYRDLPSQSDDFELRISYQELIDKGLLRNNPNSSSLYILDNINPRLRYHGHYTLDLDYIEIEDKMHRVLEENIDEYNTGVNARIAEIMPAAYEDLVMGIYTLDEPMQPQFDAFKTVQGMVNLPGVKPMTAIHDYQYNKFRMGCVEDIFYDHIDLFCNSTNPDVIMPDLYPIKPNSPGYMVPEVLDWNNPDHTNTCNENVFIQTVLSRKVTDKYRATKNYIKQNNPLNGRMYPIVQAWGSWRDERWVNFMMPPSETQKMLQYLPLCYGADGIFNYRLCGWLDHPSCDEYAALNADFVGSTPANPHYSGSSVPYIAACPITYDALHEANAKVLEYGPKISQMYWINSVTITESSMEPGGTNLSSIMISSIQDVDTDQTGPYGCYVECGMFTDAANNPYLMLVTNVSHT